MIKNMTYFTHKSRTLSNPQFLQKAFSVKSYLLLVGLLVLGLLGTPPAWGQDYDYSNGFVEEFTSPPEGPLPDWAIGPFQRGKVDGELMFFQQNLDWKGTAYGKNWEINALWNPTMIAAGDRLYVIYRAGPQMEGLQSQIGLAWSDDGGVSWQDYKNNPIIYPTEKWENAGTEDPKVYKYKGTYYLFYNGVQKMPDGKLNVMIGMATSTDLRHWKKRGRIMPQSISKGWVKGAVIPDTPEGVPVKINGKFIMYISQNHAPGAPHLPKEQMIGYSTDLIHWNFKQTTYLLPSQNKQINSIAEVATATTSFPGSPDNIVLDVFYRSPDGQNPCGQVLYSKKDPAKQLGFTPYGTCSWGGVNAYHGQWVFPQGWGWRNPGAIQLYTAPMH